MVGHYMTQIMIILFILNRFTPNKLYMLLLLLFISYVCWLRLYTCVTLATYTLQLKTTPKTIKPSVLYSSPNYTYMQSL